MKFRYTGREMTEVFGLQWGTNTVHDVTDAHAIKKLTHNQFFELVDGPNEASELPREAKLPQALENLLEEPTLTQPPHMPHHEPSIKPIQPMPARRGRPPLPKG